VLKTWLKWEERDIYGTLNVLNMSYRKTLLVRYFVRYVFSVLVERTNTKQ